MKIVTWNVNGIRSMKKNIDCVLSDLSADIACFQETKISRGQIPETTALIEGYTSYFSYPRKQSGYSGVASYCKDKFVPDDAEEGLSLSALTENASLTDAFSFSELFDDVAKFDSEGRVITTYHLIKHEDKIQRLAIINVYCPRVDPDKPERFLYKMQFCFLLEAKLRELCKTGCSVIILGDLNIVHSIIDHCDPGDENEFNSSKPRQWLKALLSSKFSFCDEETGIVDAFRHFYPNKKESYTCWNTKTGARFTNYGTRIDYILISRNLLSLLESCEILADYHGSDHCPVAAMLKCDSVLQENIQLPSICTRLWPEFTGQQQKLQAFFQKTQNLADSLTKQKEISAQAVRRTIKPTPKVVQKSMMNFLKSRPAAHNSSSIVAESSEASQEILNLDSISSNSSSSFKNEDSSVDNESDKIISTVKKDQAAAWKTMLGGPPKPPLCLGHQKECVLRTVKKKGPNCGRNFFMCSYPAGHPSNPEANCNFFQWATASKVNTFKKV
ncbi:DNA-(apurinic or apyrimidinic site) lyase 2 [Trichonephila clavata]|uniref:DNA-(apurinic or apyrimidinic site) endonuclease n=1 Tax=Trichonephila clavata TaxID=2740835 RepID=A0A8X6HJ95_TRICU|nr:DNA-(apurinic or apyrimidinic site) lyase 2 [Trichonephila clavata]